VPTMNGSRHGGKGGGIRVPTGRPRGCGGWKLPLSLNLREMAMGKRMKMS
jgi:hypothetical protein